MVRFQNGFVINPASYWLPSYRISPYSTSFNSVNYKIFNEGKIDLEVIKSDFGENFIPTHSGRAAISLALGHYNLLPTDEVLILTTSGNKYISSCVTTEIEKVCKWTREMNEKVKLIFVNHEFGYCYPDLKAISDYRLPIIEDMALSFASKDKEDWAGRIGDFVIYSLPKFFPMQFGGVVRCNQQFDLSQIHPDPELEKYFQIFMTHYLPMVPVYRASRLANVKYITDQFSSLGFSNYFNQTKENIPGVFLFKAEGIDLPEFKIFMNKNGIESSVFYGDDAYYLPIHHNLTEQDLDFFFLLTVEFLKYGNM